MICISIFGYLMDSLLDLKAREAFAEDVGEGVARADSDNKKGRRVRTCLFGKKCQKLY